MAAPVDHQTDILIIGGGASGLAAALTAARSGARAAVLEHDVACGLTILATGNGRCNLSNQRLDPAHYRHEAVARAVMGDDAELRVEAFLSSVGIVTCAVEDRLYPLSKRAESVRDALIAACTRAGVTFLCGHELTGARYDEAQGAWLLTADAPARPLPTKPHADARARLRAQRRALAEGPKAPTRVATRHVIIACGGSSEHVASLFGLPHLAERPVLCPIACTRVTGAPLPAALDGLRADARLTLRRAGDVLWSEVGEVLFRPYGISGVAAFTLSRRLAAGDAIDVDLFPTYSDDALDELFERRAQALGATWRDAGAPWFDGMLARPLADALLEEAHPSGTTPSILHLAVEGTCEERSAQVRRGGIPFDVVSLPALTVEAAGLPALSACGEALDMDADCGGFNLAWAWLSGIQAAAGALERLRR